jgi:hypothetical protein
MALKVNGDDASELNESARSDDDLATMRYRALCVTLGLLAGCSGSSSDSSWTEDGGVDTAGDGSVEHEEEARDATLPVPGRCMVGAGELDAGDPRGAVTDWAQVARYNCLRDNGSQVIPCVGDDGCPSGLRCDTSANCGCCVNAPPAAVPTQALRRGLLTSCTAGRCGPPSYCTLAADGRTCAMTFNGTIYVWATTYEPATDVCALDDLRRRLCIKVETTQDCLWILDIPGGSYTADAPFPTHYSDSYECGGRTCNGADTFRVAPNATTTFTARLVVDNCSQ